MDEGKICPCCLQITDSGVGYEVSPECPRELVEQVLGYTGYLGLPLSRYDRWAMETACEAVLKDREARADLFRAALETIDFEARENKQTGRAFRMTLRRIVKNAFSAVPSGAGG